IKVDEHVTLLKGGVVDSYLPEYPFVVAVILVAVADVERQQMMPFNHLPSVDLHYSAAAGFHRLLLVYIRATHQASKKSPSSEYFLQRAPGLFRWNRIGMHRVEHKSEQSVVSHRE